jgi:uncharacterized protein
MSKALIAAIDANDPEAVRAALKEVKDINRKLPGLNKPLLYACEKGADKVLDVLFDAGAIAERRNTDPWETPFAVAAKHKQAQVMERLLMSMQASDKAVEHVLHMAAMDGDSETLEMALKVVKPPITIGLFRLGPASKNASRILKLLIQFGGDVNGRHETDRAKQRTPLHALVGRGKPEVIRTLVEAGADVNARDSLGRTPLMILALNLEGIEVSKARAPFLQRLKATPGAVVIGSEIIPDDIGSIQTTLELGADATLVDNEGNDAIDHCLFEYQRWDKGNKKPDAQILEVLRNAGAKGSKSTMNLFDAIRNKDLNAVHAAIAAGADVNRLTPSKCPTTPLCCAVCGSDKPVEIVRALLNAGANPNKYSETSTPLIDAAGYGNLAIVKELVGRGANIHALTLDDDYPDNAYSAALDEHKEVADYLRSLGATKPKPTKTEPLEPGVKSWNDFSELLIKSTVEHASGALAKMIQGTVKLNVYGQSVKPGKKAYVVVRPKGMDWCNVFQITPPRNRFEDSEKHEAFASEFAKASEASVLSIEYSDTSDAASVFRAEPDGTSSKDARWDRDYIEEFFGDMGDEAPEWAKKRLAEPEDEDEPSGTERLVMLAQQEKFVIAAFGPDYEPGDELEIEFTGYGAEVFDGVAFVTQPISHGA